MFFFLYIFYFFQIFVLIKNKNLNFLLSRFKWNKQKQITTHKRNCKNLKKALKNNSHLGSIPVGNTLHFYYCFHLDAIGTDINSHSLHAIKFLCTSYKMHFVKKILALYVYNLWMYSVNVPIEFIAGSWYTAYF